MSSTFQYWKFPEIKGGALLCSLLEFVGCITKPLHPLLWGYHLVGDASTSSTEEKISLSLSSPPEKRLTNCDGGGCSIIEVKEDSCPCHWQLLVERGARSHGTSYPISDIGLVTANCHNIEITIMIDTEMTWTLKISGMQ